MKGRRLSDGKQNSVGPERKELQPRGPRGDFGEQLKRICDKAIGNLKRSSGMPKEGDRGVVERLWTVLATHRVGRIAMD